MSSSQASLAKRLKALTALMSQHGVDYYLLSTGDEHLNEYVPVYRRRLEAMTGFSGSAGTVIFSREARHALFIDSRYHLQAEQETDATEFFVQKLGMEGVPTPEKWLTEQEKLRGPLCLGVDPFLTTPKNWHKLQKALHHAQSGLRALQPNLIDLCWENRPPAPARPIYVLGDELTGESCAAKLDRLREELKTAGVEALILSKLDEIAWLLNLRGSDIECNPVFEAYAIIERERALCFHLGRLTPEAKQALSALVEFRPYAEYPKALQTLAERPPAKIWLDGESTSMGTYLFFKERCRIEEKPHPLVLWKALKNPVEVEQAYTAHRHSARGKIRALARLEALLKAGERVSEKAFADLLYREYAREPGFADLSFPTIAATGPNGAIVHYGKVSEQEFLQMGQLLLVDSGIQILGGTTDDTRTIILGTPDERQKRLYTLVLQAHVRLARQVFPQGTNGAALDAITRAGLWNAGVDFGHGTGHGVGAFLNVHEGPQRIAPMAHEVALQPGMIVSNEPGYYEAGWGGIRLENLYVVTPAPGHPAHPGGKSWLKLEALTRIPFDRRLVERSLLSAEEWQWLVRYHQQVWQEIGPGLEKEAQDWLQWACDWH